MIYYKKSIISLLLIFSISFTTSVFAESSTIFFDFEDYTLQGWEFTQKDYEGISDIGTYYYGCGDAYSFELSNKEGKYTGGGIKIGPEKEYEAYACRVGINKTFTVTPNSDIIISFDARATSSAQGSTVSNVRLYVYGGDKIPDERNEIGLSYYNKYTDRENPEEEKMLFPRQYGKGDYDSGWKRYTIIVNTEDYSQITFFIATADGWTANWRKTFYIDNIEITDIGLFVPIITEISEKVSQLTDLVMQYRLLK